MDFKYRLMQFMSGRYGTDSFTYGLMTLAFVTAFINIFVRSVIIQFLVYAIFFYAVFRLLSRNIEARRNENLFFINKINFLKNKIDLYKRQKNDKCHVYRKCPNCKAILRLPYKIGTHTTVCPRCSKEFKVKVRK